MYALESWTVWLFILNDKDIWVMYVLIAEQYGCFGIFIFISK